ncbi:MAG TPA: hypothetical protein VMM76_25175 [Pirellulaceae bacterium]|nr:hypothetical protein [Pirellulaceae bacterium]
MMRRHWRHKYSVLLIAILLLLAAHGRILEFAATALVCDQRLPQGDTIAIVSGDGRFDFAAQAVAEDRAQRILLFEDGFRWLVQIGALPPGHEIDQQHLVTRNVHQDQIELLAGPVTNHWDRAVRLTGWLDQHADGSILLLCDRFESRRVRSILDQVLPESKSERVRIVGLADRRFDETNWWQSRTGVKSFVDAMLALLHSYAVGLPPPVKSNSWDPVEYERRLGGEVRGQKSEVRGQKLGT